MPDDKELLTLWRSGDNNAGKALFTKYGPDITAYFQRKLYDTSEVAGLVNATFFTCIAARSPFLGPATAVRPYLYGIAHNKLREHLRQRKSATRLIDASADAEELAEASLGELDPRDPSDFVEQLEERKLILKALRRIPLGYQLIIELSFWEGLSNPEIAEALDLKLGTVASRLRLGREHLDRAVRALQSSPELLESTTMSLSTWIEHVKKYGKPPKQ